MMRKIMFMMLLVTASHAQSLAQNKFPDDPDSAKFVTKDIDNFWKAFADFEHDSTVNDFGSKYIDIGSEGVKGFTPDRIQSARHLFTVVKQRKGDYEKVKENTIRIREKEKQCRSYFYALKYLYPQAKFPPVYFVVGAYNSGGTSNKAGLIIGAEMQTNIDNIPYVVAHELIHFQQTFPTKTATLLQQSIIEGSADFIAGLITGSQLNSEANKYGNEHKEQLCKEFIAKMNGANYTDWLYGTSKKDDRPNDLGYWIGYQITAQYYANANDKRKAIFDILNIKDYNEFLKKSGYLDAFMK